MNLFSRYKEIILKIWNIALESIEMIERHIMQICITYFLNFESFHSEFNTIEY